MGHARVRLLIEEWPEGDRAAWQQARRSSDPLSDPGMAAHWSDKTVRPVLASYGMWLSWLRDLGHLDPLALPGGRITRERLRDFLGWLQDRGIGSVTLCTHLRNLREAIRVIDRRYRLDDLDMTLARLERRAQPRRSKTPRLVHPRDLLLAAIAAMQAILRSKGKLTRGRAARYRDALIVGFLATRPIRLANLGRLEIDRHIFHRSEGYCCRLEPHETKDRNRLEFSLAPALAEFMDRYIEAIRPLLMDRGMAGNRLWVSSRGSPMCEAAIYQQVNAFTKAMLGKPINPHLFRDCVATAIAEDAPEEAQIIARILGHSTLATSEQHYNHAGSISAHRRYMEALITLRRPVIREDVS